MPTNREQPSRSQVETDPRFPSGEWKGFWLQRGMPGRQWMSLALEFSAGKVAGEGRDCVGQFVISGAYHLDTGRCSMLKGYVGSHTVRYDGANEGDGKWLWGMWKIVADSGGFHLWPKGEQDPTGSELSAEKELPTRREKRLVLEPIGS